MAAAGFPLPSSLDDGIFSKDLLFIKNIIYENHPGICNQLDPQFASQLNKSYDVANQTLDRLQSEAEKMQVIGDFGKSFQDAHLWVRYDEAKNIDVKSPNEPPRTFDLKKVASDVTWVAVPTFAPSTGAMDNFLAITRALPQLQSENIVFDLRGNGGGNSQFGVQLLAALFGSDYVEYRLAEADRKVSVDWRASKGNLEHIENLMPRLRTQFADGHPAIQWAETAYKGLLSALSRGDPYYSAPASSDTPSEVPSQFKGRVIAIVDRGCGSACLDFLDGLKAMQANVVLIGEPTAADSVYMELRTVKLPSGQGTFGFPIKVYRNRPRGHNVPHLPDIRYDGDLKNNLALEKFVLEQVLPISG